MAEALAQQRFNPEGVSEAISIWEFLTIRDELSKRKERDVYTQWVNWFFADRSTRAISPNSAVTLPEYIRGRIQQDTLESLHEAIWLSSTNGLAVARLALRTAQAPIQNSRHAEEADFYSKRALKLSPDNPEVKTIRAEVLSWIGSTKSKEASEIRN